MPQRYGGKWHPYHLTSGRLMRAHPRNPGVADGMPHGQMAGTIYCIGSAHPSKDNDMCPVIFPGSSACSSMYQMWVKCPQTPSADNKFNRE